MSNIPSNNRVNSSNPNEGYMRRNISNITFDIDSLLPSEQNTFYDFSQHGHDDLIYQAEEVPNQQDDEEYEYYICKVPKNRNPSKGSPITPISNVNTIFQSIDKDQYDQCSKLIQQSMKKSRMNDNFIRSSHNLTDSKPFQSQYFTVSNKKISCEKLYHFYIHPQYGQVPVIPLKIYLSNTLRLFLGDPISPDDIIIYQDSKSRENQLYLLQRRFSKSYLMNKLNRMLRNSLLCWCNQCQCNTRAYTKLAKSSYVSSFSLYVFQTVYNSLICGYTQSGIVWMIQLVLINLDLLFAPSVIISLEISILIIMFLLKIVSSYSYSFQFKKQNKVYSSDL